MRKILILMGRYLPGHKDGGPLRTMINVTDMLGDEYDFYIACLDRDHGDTVPYPNIKRDEWNRVGKANVWYVSPGGFTDELIMQLADGKDLIYLSSFYDDYGYKTLILKKKGKITIPVALASMGVFSKGALAQKALKKKLFITACKMTGLFKGITWSVTSELEANDVKKAIGNKINYVVAEDPPRSSVSGRLSAHHTPARVVFLSRISPKKNLIGAIKAFYHTKSEMIFTIYGPIEDKEYWNKCKEALEKLPKNIKYVYKGDVLSENVQNTLAEHDIFLFPTLGENYGHVIFEALSVGCIPVISDQTPWESIMHDDAGFILPLTSDMSNYSNVMDRLAEMSIEERYTISERAVNIAKEKVEASIGQTGYRKILDEELL